MKNQELESGLAIIVDMRNKKVGRTVDGKTQLADMPRDRVFPEDKTFSYSNFRRLVTVTALEAGLIDQESEINKWYWEMSQSPKFNYSRYLNSHNPAVFSFEPRPELPFDRRNTSHLMWYARPYGETALFYEELLYRPNSQGISLGAYASDDTFDNEGETWDYPKRRVQENGHRATGSWYFYFPGAREDALLLEESPDSECPIPDFDSEDPPTIKVCAFIEAPESKALSREWTPKWGE